MVSDNGLLLSSHRILFYPYIVTLSSGPASDQIERVTKLSNHQPGKAGGIDYPPARKLYIFQFFDHS